MAMSFIGGGNRSTGSKPPTCRRDTYISEMVKAKINTLQIEFIPRNSVEKHAYKSD
jgi:hypothetical protein